MITLYAIPGSNASMSARLALEHKRLGYRRVDLLPTLHGPLLRLIGFRRSVVPAMILHGRRVQGSLEVPRALELLQPFPSLFPAGSHDRVCVEQAERWGESVLQALSRRLAWWALSRDRNALRTFAVGASLHIPLELAMAAARPVTWMELRAHRASDRQVESDVRRLPRLLDQVDSWILQGVLGRSEPTAADFQIAPSLRLLMCSEQLRPLIAGRACGGLAMRTVKDFPGRLPRAFPSEWLVS